MKKLVIVVLFSAVAAIAMAYDVHVLRFNFAGVLPDEVRVERACYPGTQDAVYVARAFEGHIAMQVVSNGCAQTARTNR
jgi:hypothetical protein